MLETKHWFLSWRIKKWLSSGWLQRLSGEALGWGNGAGRRSWPLRRLQAVGIHTGPATKMSLWPVLAAPLALHKYTLTDTHTHQWKSVTGGGWGACREEERWWENLGIEGRSGGLGCCKFIHISSPSLHEQSQTSLGESVFLVNKPQAHNGASNSSRVRERERWAQ